jgi:hypothetical protein
MPVDATAVIGLLVGFLVVGVIGIYVGDQMVVATNITPQATWSGHGTTCGKDSLGNHIADDVNCSELSDSAVAVIETFQLGVTLCKIIVIVSVASIVFVLLQKTGLIPRFGQE